MQSTISSVAELLMAVTLTHGALPTQTTTLSVCVPGTVLEVSSPWPYTRRMVPACEWLG